MATIKKVSKAQTGKTLKYNELEKRLMQAEKKDSINQKKSYTNQRANKVIGKNKMGGTTMAKNGKSFPDLNKDGKITKADILKGRGVIAKKGMKIKKAQNGDSTMYYAKKSIKDVNDATKILKQKGVFSKEYDAASKKENESMNNLARQSKKGKPGYDKMGNPVKKNKMGGKTTASMMKKGGKMTKKCAYGCK